MEELEIWRVAVKILNKKWLTAERGGPATWRYGEALTSPHCKKLIVLRYVQKRLGVSKCCECGDEPSVFIKCGEILE
jgi:hypothetical protein